MIWNWQERPTSGRYSQFYIDYPLPSGTLIMRVEQQDILGDFCCTLQWKDKTEKLWTIFSDGRILKSLATVRVELAAEAILKIIDAHTELLNAVRGPADHGWSLFESQTGSKAL